MPEKNAKDDAARLDDRLERLRDEYGDVVELSEIGRIVKDILGSLHGDLSAKDLKMYSELEALAQYIMTAKQDIASIRPEDIPNQHIPIAGCELDAIGSHLEEATGTILDACERVEDAIEDVDADHIGPIADAVTCIYEACNFQDIAGQRITKVVYTLEAIERRINMLINAFNKGTPIAEFEEPPDGRPDAHLLNGPQTPENANSQDDIDALFN